jgi:hypothetical protein
VDDAANATVVPVIAAAVTSMSATSARADIELQLLFISAPFGGGLDLGQ